MSVSSRISGREYSNMNAFVTDLQLGVNDDVAALVTPLREEISSLRRDINNLRETITQLATQSSAPSE
jgi:hypothetical protein